MARIRVRKDRSAILVVVAGRLKAADIRRLEHACSPALTSPRADLVVDIQQVSELDRIALTLLQRMASRGATIRRVE